MRMVWWSAFLKQAGKKPFTSAGVDGAKWAGDWTGSAYELGKQVQCFHDGESAPPVKECEGRNDGGEMNVTSCRNNNVTGQGSLWIMRGETFLQGCGFPAAEDQCCSGGFSCAGWQKLTPADVPCPEEAGLTDQCGPLKWAISLPDCSPLGSDFLKANHWPTQKLASCVASLVAPLVGSSAAVLGSWWNFIEVTNCFGDLEVKRGQRNSCSSRWNGISRKE